MYDASLKMFFILHSINWPNFVVLFQYEYSYSLLPGYEVMNIEINFIFLIKLFLYLPKIQDKITPSRKVL